MRSGAAIAIAIVLALPALAPVARAAPVATAKVVVHDASKIYLGDPKSSTAPAVIHGGRVLEATPEVKEIRRRGLTDKDAQYWILLGKATERFHDAVKCAAKKDKKDLVAETGAISVSGETVPDITETAIAEISA